MEKNGIPWQGTYASPDLVRESIHEIVAWKLRSRQIAEEMELKDGRNFQVKEKAYAKQLRREDTNMARG